MFFEPPRGLGVKVFTSLFVAIFFLFLALPIASAVQYTEYHGYNSTADGSSTAKRGEKILMKQTIYISGFELFPEGSLTATNGYLLDSSKTVLASCNITALNCTFPSAYQLQNNTLYYVVVDKGGLTYNTRHTSPPSYPITGTYLNWITSLLDASDDTTYILNIRKIYLYENDSLPLPTINFNPSTANNLSEYYYGDTFSINTTASYFGGTVTSSHYIYNSSGSLKLQYNGSVNLTSNYTGLTPGIYYFNATATNTSNSSITGTRQVNISQFNAYLNLTLKNALNLSILGTSTINITDFNTSVFSQYNTTTGNINARVEKSHRINISIDATGYVLNSTVYNLNATAQQYLNISLYTNNSVYTLIYDEGTGFTITQNITVVFSGATEYTYYTSNGSLYVDNLTDGAYTVKFSGSNYTLKQYSITVLARSFQYLNAYLSSTTAYTVFTIEDYDGGFILPGATVTQTRLINGSWTVIDTKNSDISGRVQFSYNPYIKYGFTVTLTGYLTQVFYLDPVLFSTYTIRLQRSTVQTEPSTPDYQDITETIYPLNFTANSTHNLTYTIVSPGGKLISYSINSTGPYGIYHYDAGNNAYGETFIQPLNISSGVNFTDRIHIRLCYETTTSGARCRTRDYAIHPLTGNFTWVNSPNQIKDVATFDKILIGSIILLFIGGVAGAVLGLSGAALGLLMGCMVLYPLGFFTYWTTVPSVLIAVFILMFGDKR